MRAKKDCKLCQSWDIFSHGTPVPYNSLYGTFRGYDRPTDFLVKEYPLTPSGLKVWIFTGVDWMIAPYQRFKKLYAYVTGWINSLGLWGTRTIRPVGRIVFPSGNPNKRQRITALRAANKRYSERGIDSRYDMYRNDAGELEFKNVCTKTIVYP